VGAQDCSIAAPSGGSVTHGPSAERTVDSPPNAAGVKIVRRAVRAAPTGAEVGDRFSVEAPVALTAIREAR
jgi:hypothetical protein